MDSSENVIEFIQVNTDMRYLGVNTILLHRREEIKTKM